MQGLFWVLTMHKKDSVVDNNYVIYKFVSFIIT